MSVLTFITIMILLAFSIAVLYGCAKVIMHNFKEIRRERKYGRHHRF